jgi:hypothetical protein
MPDDRITFAKPFRIGGDASLQVVDANDVNTASHGSVMLDCRTW